MQDIAHTSDSGLYILKNVTRNDAGEYKCEAMDFDSLDVQSLTKTLIIHVHCE